MKKCLVITASMVCLIFISDAFVRACTTMIVTPGATVDGSMLVTHSDDNELCDERIIYVPAADHEPGSMRAVYASAIAAGELPEYNSYLYPRLVSNDRGPGYATDKYPKSIPLGYIPQVPHTYAYFDGSYGIMNEHQLMIGECTNGAKVKLRPEPGKRIFYSAELSRVALERCKTAREAVELMGSLIEKYGYYGTGETLLVADPKEGWVFEVTGGTRDGTGGLWVAKRVPDGTLFVAANQFKIREVKPGDPDILYSPRLFKELQARGWWNPSEGPLDWLKAVSKGEYNHPYYSLRRVWRVQSNVAPSLKLSPWVKDGYTRDYPFSVTPDRRLTVRDVMNLHRDHYEGTEFDMTQGIAAGPFGFPNRHYGPEDGRGDVGDPGRKLEGAWERPISVAYCGYVYVNQGRSWLPDPIGGVSWMGLDKPAETCFVPLYAGVYNLPESFQNSNPAKFDRSSAWWAFNFVSNWSALKYSYMKEDIHALQERIELDLFAAQKKVESEAVALIKKDPAAARRYLTKYTLDTARDVVGKWWSLADQLIVKYNDGYINEAGHMAREIGYPEWWLNDAGWKKGPTTYTRPEGR